VMRMRERSRRGMMHEHQVDPKKSNYNPNPNFTNLYPLMRWGDCHPLPTCHLTPPSSNHVSISKWK